MAESDPDLTLTEAADLEILLPDHAHFSDASDLADRLADQFMRTTIGRANPRAPLAGGPGPDSFTLAVLVMIGVALTAFGVRFFILLADDAHGALRHALLALSRKLQGLREDEPTSWMMRIQVRGDRQVLEMMRFYGRFASETDVGEMARAAARLLQDQPAHPTTASRAIVRYWAWDSEHKRWVSKYDSDSEN
jgi:hypothetical protein